MRRSLHIQTRGKRSPERASLHSIIPPIIPDKPPLRALESGCQRNTAENKTKKVLGALELTLVGRQAKNKINRYVVCEAMIRVTEKTAAGEGGRMGVEGCILDKLKKTEYNKKGATGRGAE